MLENFRKRLARAIAPKGKRMYQAARTSRLTGGWGSAGTSADSELRLSLTTLRDRSRALVRDAAYAKRAKAIVVANVIGPGIGLQAQVGTSRDGLNERINSGIERAWEEWCRPENCHTGGVLHFSDMERTNIGETFEAGEIFVRIHLEKFGNSKVPLALELLEGELCPENVQPEGVAQGNTVRNGVEVDSYFRPVAYHFKRLHSGDAGTFAEYRDRTVRIPAAQLFHIKLTDRWPQTRGEPWLHAVARKLNDMDGYSEAEITAARSAACYMGWIETPEPDSPLATEQTSGTGEQAFEPGMFKHGAPGEKINWFTPTRPNSAMDPFMRMMLREVASGVGVSYESLSRDYSQSNYSSSRLALLDDRDLWRTLQRWIIRSFREPLHRLWLQQAVLAGAIPEIPVEQYVANPAKFEAVRFKPRGWSWIDPTKEIEAYKSAIRAGITTLTDVIAATGNGDDVEDVLERRARELKLIDEIEKLYEVELSFDTDPDKLDDGSPAQPADTGEPPGEDQSAETDTSRPARLVSFRR